MRMPFAKTALASALSLLTAASTGEAQSGRATYGAADLGSPQWADPAAASVPYGPGYVGDPGPLGVSGAMFQPQYGTMPPPALYPPQAPNTMNPWPEVSPFYPPNVSYTQHQNKGGLWFKDAVHRQTDYEFGLDYILTSFKEPHDRIVGSNFLPLVNFGGVMTPVGQVVVTNNLSPEQDLGLLTNTFPGAFPFPILLDGTALITFPDTQLFPIMTTGALAGGLDSNGIKAHWAAFNEDGTGWNLRAFFAPEANTNFARGNETLFDVPITQQVILANPGLISSLYGAVPLIFSNQLFGIDGNTQGFLGDTQKYDILYRLDYSTWAAGGQANRYNGLLHKSDSVRVTSFYGARYMYLDETFQFHGIDSGLGYDIETDGDNIDFGRPTGGLTIAYPLMDSRLNSTVQSHLAGAQGGFRIDIGHKGAFHVWAETTGGLLANYETLEVNGNNIGVPLLRPDMHDGVQFLDNSFRDKERHTHVSPLFEQSIYADIRLRHIFPFLKHSYFLEEAQFRCGYTFTWIGEVARPGSTINWVGFPKFPGVKVSHESFTMDQLSLGLTIPY